MPPPEPPHRGVPLGRVTAEPNVATAPHTPIPPAASTAVTARPPRPDPRDPPKQYARPRPMVRAPSVERSPLAEPFDSEEHTKVGPEPVLDEGDRPSTVEAIQSAHTLADVVAEKNARIAALESRLTAAAPLPALPPAVSAPVERASLPPTDAMVRVLLFKLAGAILALVAAATVGIEAYTQYVKLKVDVLSAKVTAQEAVTKPLPAAAASAVNATDACRDWARATDDYHRQIFAKLGVIIPQQPNAPPVTEIKTRAPAHKANSVTGAPVLEVLTAPPALP